MLNLCLFNGLYRLGCMYANVKYSGGFFRSYPRNALYHAPKDGLFGLDTGYDYHKPPDHAACPDPRNDATMYNDDHPPAVYFPGQKVVLTHPVKVRK